MSDYEGEKSQDEETMEVESSPEKGEQSTHSTPEQRKPGNRNSGISSDGSSRATYSGGSSSSSGGSNKRRGYSQYTGSPAKQQNRDYHSTSPSHLQHTDNGYYYHADESPNSASLSQSQMHLSNVSLSSPSAEQYVNLSQVLGRSSSFEPSQSQNQGNSVDDSLPYPSDEMTQRSPLDRNRQHSPRPRTPKTVRVNDREYVSLEDFQRALNPILSQDSLPNIGASLRSRAQSATGRDSCAQSATGRDSRAQSATGRESRAQSATGRESHAHAATGRESHAHAATGRESHAHAATGRDYRAHAATGRDCHRGGPVRNLRSAFRDSENFDDDDDDDEETVTISECLLMKNESVVNVTCVCYVIELEPEQGIHPLVVKPRRKICVGDSTGVMVGYIKKSQPVHFEKGNTLRLYGFTMRMGQFLIHANTSASTACDIQIPDQIKLQGIDEYYRPQTPFMTVSCMRQSPNGTTGSLKGTVTTTEHARTVGKQKQSLVKTVTVKDCTGDIKCSLWGSAANGGEIELGQQIVLCDAKTYFDNIAKEIRVNVNNADQIQLKPPEDLDEMVKVKGIEQTDHYSTLILACVKSRQNERLTIDRQILCNLFNGGAPVTIRQILNYLPFRAKVHITGQCITTMENVRVSTRVLARLQSGPHVSAQSSRGVMGQSGDSNRGQPSASRNVNVTSGRPGTAPPSSCSVRHSSPTKSVSSVREMPTTGGSSSRRSTSARNTPVSFRKCCSEVDCPFPKGHSSKGHSSSRKHVTSSAAAATQSSAPAATQSSAAAATQSSAAAATQSSAAAATQSSAAAATQSSSAPVGRDFEDFSTQPSQISTNDSQDIGLSQLFKEDKPDDDLTPEEEEKLMAKSDEECPNETD